MATIRIHPNFLWAAGTVWPPVCVAVVGARFATRRAQRANLGLDDWLTLPALILNIGMAVTLLIGVGQHSLGYPTPPPIAGETPLTAENSKQRIARKAYLAATLLSIASLTFIKLSCMIFYHRIFHRGMTRVMLVTIYTICVLIIMWGVGCFFAQLFPCGTHIDYLWGSEADLLLCPVNLNPKFNEALVISDFVMDFIILLFPIPLVVKLQMSNAHKIAVLFIFALGSLTIAASITRLVLIVQGTQAVYLKNVDGDFLSTVGVYLELLEACFALCTICLPTLSGALKLKGVQAFVSGFTTALSNISSTLSPSRSTRSRESHERLDSIRSGPRSGPSRSVRPSTSDQKLDTDLEMYPLPKGDKILVTNENFVYSSAAED